VPAVSVSGLGLAVASIQIYFEAAKCFPSQRGRGQSPRPKGPRVGMGFLGRGQRAPTPPPMGVGERCKRGPGWNPQKNLKFVAT